MQVNWGIPFLGWAFGAIPIRSARSLPLMNPHTHTRIKKEWKKQYKKKKTGQIQR